MKYLEPNSWLDSLEFQGVLYEFNEKIPFVESLVPHVLPGARVVMNYAHFTSTNRGRLENRGDKA